MTMESNLCDMISELSQQFDKFDFSETVKANGYRSFVMIAEAFLKKKFEDSEEGNTTHARIADLLTQVATLLIRLQYRTNTHDSVTDLDEEIMLTSMAVNSQSSSGNPFGQTSVDPFWFTDPVRASMDQLNEALGQFLRTDNENMMRETSAKDIVLDIKAIPLSYKSEWTVSCEADCHAVIVRDPRNMEEAIDLMILKPKLNQHPDCVYFYVHGGGWSFGSVFVVSQLLAHFCDQIGVVTVAPNYRKSPVHRFPCALQDVIDAYLFLTNGPKEQVFDVLGFVPGNIVLGGESSGANLVLSLTFALKSISDLSGEEVHLPAGIHLTYPLPTPSPIVFPSTLSQNLDNMMSQHSMANIMGRYAFTDPLLQTDWHLDQDGRKNHIRSLRHSAGDPLFNNLSYKDWSSLRQIPLIVHVSEFDPLLDQGIQLAKQWKGLTAVRVARGLPHCFVFMKSNEAQQEVNIMMKDIACLLNGEWE